MNAKITHRKKVNIQLTVFTAYLNAIANKYQLIAKSAGFQRLKQSFHVNKGEELKHHVEKSAYLQFRLYQYGRNRSRRVKAQYFRHWHKKMAPVKLLVDATTRIRNALVLKTKMAMDLLRCNKNAYRSFMQHKKRLAIRLRRLQEQNHSLADSSNDTNKTTAALVARLEFIVKKRHITLKEAAFSMIFNNSVENEDADVEDLYISYKLLKKEKVSSAARNLQIEPTGLRNGK